MENLTVPKRLMQALRRKAEESGLTPVETLLDVIIAATDPEERPVAYIEAAQELLVQARQELEAGDERQASEKIWGAAALAVKAYACAREQRRITSHSELWQYKSRIAEELGDWIHDAWAQADAMYTNFYEGWADKQSIQKALERGEKPTEAIKQKIKQT
ncbi:MAG: PaREP1 family protein [Nitrososphaerota archaeon]